MRELRNRRHQLKVRSVEIIRQGRLRQLIHPLIVFRYLRIAIRAGMESIKVIEDFDNGFFVRREIHRLFGLGADHDEAQDFRWQEIRHLPRRNPQSLGRTHLGAADQKKLVRDVERRGLIKNPAQTGRGHVPRAALCGVIFARALNRNVERFPLGGPFELPGEFALAVKRRNFSLVATPGCPGDEVGPAGVGDFFAVVVGDLGRANASALFAHGLEGVPVIRPLGLTDLFVDAPDGRSVAQNIVSGLIELTRAIDIAQPVGLGLNVQVAEHAEKILNIMFGDIGKGRARRWRHLTQRHAEIGPEKLFFACRQLIQRVVVINPKSIPDRQPTGLNRPENDIVNEYAPQSANVSAARGGLRVVNELFSLNLGGDFITPKHASSPTCVFSRSVSGNPAKKQALLCYENTKKAKAKGGQPQGVAPTLYIPSPLAGEG